MNEAQFFSGLSEPFRPRPLAPDVMFDVEISLKFSFHRPVDGESELLKFVLVVVRVYGFAMHRIATECSFIAILL